MDDWCVRSGIACAYFAAGPDDFSTLQLAEDAGFRCVDVRATLVCRPQAQLEYDGPQVREFEERDRAQVAGLARRSYHLTRFYNDPRFPDERCADFYERWMMESCNGLADCVWVAERDGRLVGYMTCVLDRGKAHGRLVLTAVEPNVRGRGIGRALVVAAVEWLQHNGAEEVRGSTQAANVTMQRILQRVGFVAEDTDLWFHKWYRDDVVADGAPS